MSTTVSEIEAEPLRGVPTELFVDGKWTSASGDDTFPVRDPATDEVLAEVADATPSDGTAALDAAVRAQRDWARTAPRTRADVLRRAFELVQEHADDLALLMTLEMGKPLGESRGEVRYGGEFVRWFSEEAVRVDGRDTSSPEQNGQMVVTHRPLGPVLAITPWNFPLAMATRKIAPALAAGCAVVIKPPALTPLTTLMLASLLQRAGVPDGVVNVVPTSKSSAVCGPLIADTRLRKLSFTGSTEVGVRLLEPAGTVLRTSMELGGNAAFLVFDDADLDAAVEGALLAKFDARRGQRLIEDVDTGMMGLNVGVVSNAAAPFGGVKQSGLGREGGAEGIHEYLETKYTLVPHPHS